MLGSYLRGVDFFKGYTSDKFASSLHEGIEVRSDFAKNAEIAEKRGVLRVVYKGVLIDSMSKPVPLHQVLPEGQRYFNYVCEHQAQCDCESTLVVFEIDRAAFENLREEHLKNKEYQMSFFLSYVDFVQKLSSSQINRLARVSQTATYGRGEPVFAESDFPLQKFFIVKRGAVSLRGKVNLKASNFMPQTTAQGKLVYEVRQKRTEQTHQVALLGEQDYYGLLECLSNMQAAAIQLGLAAAENTELVWLEKTELIRVYERAQLSELLELLQSKPSLGSNLEGKQLVINAMVENKLEALQQPRSQLLPAGQPVPKRLQQLYSQNKRSGHFNNNATKGKAQVVIPEQEPPV